MGSTPVEKAKEVFDSYCAMDGDELPENPYSALQVKLYRWQQRNFGLASNFQLLAGITEEVGELAHAMLKNSQRIRGMADPQVFREAAGDAIADQMVYQIQLCTSLRLDWWTLLSETAANVMSRDWIRNPETGGV